MDLSRRHFLRMAGYGLGGAALTAVIERFSAATALAQSPGYRALVCIFLGGGNDSNNTLVPLDTTGYTAYASVRNGAGLALPQANLLPLAPNPAGLGPYGLHPSLTELQALWAQGKLAIVCNTGPLVQRLTREEYQKGGSRPFQLFSHADQVTQWQTSRADTRSATGWGGRIADRFPPAPSGFPMITSVAGAPIFATGVTTRPLAIAPAPVSLDQVLVLSGFGTAADEVARRNSFNFLRTIDRSATLVAAASDVTQQALAVDAALTVDPTLTTVFPNSGLGNQLRQVAKVIKANLTQPALNLTRQIFFCSQGGYDTHQNQNMPNGQVGLLRQLSEAMKAFYDATVELGVASAVTTFTLSDFGRTLQPAGAGASVGTDHAWGSHQFIMGGAVRGQAFYGVPGKNGTVLPTLQLGGPDDTDTRGRWIPTTSVEQYAATLATWYGLGAADLPVVFPLLSRFTPADLGFLV